MTPDRPVFLLLGSNIDPEHNLMEAIRLLRGRTRIRAVSSVWESPPADGSDQADYLNAAVMAETDIAPEDVAERVAAPVERALGRLRTADGFAPRTIDIDVVLIGDLAGTFGGKPIPHPDLLRRSFAAVPLAELAPDLFHPVTGESLRAIAERLKEPPLRRRPEIHLYEV